jgi:hypothetical protein
MKDNIAAKTAVTVLLLFLIVALLTSCAPQTVKKHNTERFMIVETFRDCAVYVDLQTGVEWILRGDAFAPAVDSYGRPLLWPAFDAREDRAP